MLRWLAFEVSILYICSGLTIIDPSHSQLTAVKEGENTETNDNNYLVEDSNVVSTDDDSSPKSSHDRLLHHHMMNTLDPIDIDQLNEQITILSEKQKVQNEERLEKLEEIVKWLQTNIPLSDTEHIHTLLQNIVNNTINPNENENENNNSNMNISLEYLEILRDYLHQIDNAIDFGKMGGLAIMLQLVLNYPFIEVRASAAWTIGLACQNNPSLMEIAHNISTVENILYLLKISSNENEKYPKINLLNINNINYLTKLIWTLSALTRQNDKSYEIFSKYDGMNIMYNWIMEIYSFWNSNKNNPQLLNDNYKNKIIEKVLMFASDVVVLNPEKHLFIDDKWCDVFAAHFNYAQKHYQMREITLAYWDVAIHKLFCLNCIPFGDSKENIINDHLSVDIGLKKLMTMDIQDEFDLEMKSKATHLMNLIQNTHIGL